MHLIFEWEHDEQNGALVRIRIWRVPRDKCHPEGIRYSMVYSKGGKRIIGYDNYECKGHHRHIKSREGKYDFVDEWQTIADFLKDVEQVRLWL